MTSLMNKERAVFLAAVAVFLIGMVTMLARSPLVVEEPEVPPLLGALGQSQMTTIQALYAGAPVPYRRDPFASRNEWAPPKPAGLPDLEPLPGGFALPRINLRPGVPLDDFAIQIRPPKEVVDPPPEEGDEEDPEEETGG
ncbi:MAG: hypothetical protein O7H41_01080 [Planctomycetota bacterium]|nr:hypothetical protein [Planctomycetota bacterium]